MSIRHRLGSVRYRTAGLVIAAATVAGLAAVAGPALANSGGSGMAMAGTSGHSRVGTTRGWFDGRTVTFRYSKQYRCFTPPASHAATKCEAGAEYDGIPSTTFDPLYVVVPIGFTPPRRTLQCPTAGHCIDHPHTIDLSALFGSKADNALLPPHSHVITTLNNRQPEWWDVIVIGVTREREWNMIVQHKDYAEIQRLRTHGDSHITSNVPTNLFLYFAAK